MTVHPKHFLCVPCDHILTFLSGPTTNCELLRSCDTAISSAADLHSVYCLCVPNYTKQSGNLISFNQGYSNPWRWRCYVYLTHHKALTQQEHQILNIRILIMWPVQSHNRGTDMTCMLLPTHFIPLCNTCGSSPLMQSSQCIMGQMNLPVWH